MDWSPCESILYFDHKEKVCQNHVLKASEICKTELLIRNTPSKKVCIQDEINAAKCQDRYLYSMLETIKWVDLKIKSGEYSQSNRIMNNGFILYKDISLMQKLCDEVYKTCLDLSQPECQIIWGVLSQKFEKYITRIDWETIDNIREEPISVSYKLIKIIKKILKKFYKTLMGYLRF